MTQPDQDEVDIRSRLYQRIHELETQLAQPEQEPVAYINIEERKLEWAYKYMSWDTPTVINLPKIPLYTAPPQRVCQRPSFRYGEHPTSFGLFNPKQSPLTLEWVGLTEEERNILHVEAVKNKLSDIEVIKAIEQALKRKNT